MRTSPTGSSSPVKIPRVARVILWRETDLVNGKVVRRLHITLDATTVTETVLTQGEAVDVAQAILAAAR
jgi:hypothetical protein